MDNNELLAVAQMIEKMEERLNQRFVKIELMVENKIGQRIDSLFDGYKLTHEKQWEQEREIEAMKAKIQALELQIQAINKKLA